MSDSTYKQLAAHGKWADSMDDIVKRLLREADRARKLDATFGDRQRQ
ncbi:MAG: hypothetical protein HRF40_11440 [Nitrososphaera sp.]